jgi:hypothetical protein
MSIRRLSVAKLANENLGFGNRGGYDVFHLFEELPAAPAIPHSAFNSLESANRRIDLS